MTPRLHQALCPGRRGRWGAHAPESRRQRFRQAAGKRNQGVPSALGHREPRGSTSRGCCQWRATRCGSPSAPVSDTGALADIHIMRAEIHATRETHPGLEHRMRSSFDKYHLLSIVLSDCGSQYRPETETRRSRNTNRFHTNCQVFLPFTLPTTSPMYLSHLKPLSAFEALAASEQLKVGEARAAQHLEHGQNRTDLLYPTRPSF